MIALPAGVRVWLATGHTDMRKGMNGLALQVQQGLSRDPHAGDLYVFRGKRGDLLKDPLARWARHVALRQTAGARAVPIAVTGRWCGRYYRLSARLHARWYRLAKSATYLAASRGWISHIWFFVAIFLLPATRRHVLDTEL
jgi:transposase